MLAWSLLILFSYCCIYTIFKLKMHEALNTGQVSSVGATCKHDQGRCRVDGCTGCDKSLPDRNASQMITDRCKTQEVKQKDSKASYPFGRHESKYGRMKSLRVTFHDEPNYVCSEKNIVLSIYIQAQRISVFFKDR